MRRRRWLLTGGLAVLAIGCHDPNGVVCTEEAVFGLTVSVRDSVSGLPAGLTAVVVAQDGAHLETLQAIIADGMTFAGAVERAGTYRVTAMRTGYHDWTRHGIAVEPGVCHVTPAHVEVRLQPTGDGS